jgi:O-antigen/teichoic acid export membrane protein
MRSFDMPSPPADLPPPPSEVRGGWRSLRTKLEKHRGKITTVLLGQIVTALGLALGTRVLTELVSPSALGEYKLAIGIVGFFSGLFFRPFTQFVMRHYHDAEEHLEGHAFLSFARRVVNVATLVLGTVLVLTLFWYGRTTAGLGWVAAAVGIGLLYLHVALSFQHGVLTTQNRQKSAILIRTTTQCATPLAVAAGAWAFGQSGQFLLLAEFLLLALIFGVSAWRLRDRAPITASAVSKERQREWRRDAVHFVTPLLGVSLFSWILGVADRFILAAYHLPHDVGLYTAVYGLGSQPMLMVTGMTAQLVYPFLFKAAAQKRAETQVQVLRYVVSTAAVISALGMAALFLFGEQIIKLLLAESYRVNALPMLLWVAAGYSLLGIASSFELKAYAGKRTSVLSITYGMAAAVNLGLNLLWIPSDGALGAARATFFSFLVYLASIAVISRKLHAAPGTHGNQ